MVATSTCPNCGAVIKKSDEDTARCEYCGSQIVIRKPDVAPVTGIAPAATASGVNIPNLLTLAKYDIDAGQYKEAYERYVKVLEYDARNIDALMGRATSAGWQSKWNNLRFKEMIAGYRSAIAQVSGPKKTVLTNQAVTEINNVATAGNKALLKDLNLDGFSKSSMMTVDIRNNECIRWLNFLKNTQHLLQLLDAAHEMDPANKPVTENIIAICKFYLENRPLSEKSLDKQWPKSQSLKDLSDEQWMNLFLEYIKRYTGKMKALDPSYSPPQVNYEKGSTLVAKCGFIFGIIMILIMLFVLMTRIM